MIQLFLRSGGVGRLLSSLRADELGDMPVLPNLFYEDPALHIIISEIFRVVSDAIRNAVYDPWCHNSGLGMHVSMKLLQIFIVRTSVSSSLLNTWKILY